MGSGLRVAPLSRRRLLRVFIKLRIQISTVEREMAHFDAKVGAQSTIKQRRWILRITSSKAAKRLGTANYGGC